ncbi:hypothetical protein B566_EDAN003096 [Ephemera danica]|nr:hypothetical protein B566_EDAN003096 [Ephemera danica]
MVDNGTKVMLGISVGSFGSRPYSSLNRTSVLFVSISFIVLMVISLTWLVFYYIQRFRYFHAKDRLARRLCSAAKKALSKIPTKNIRSEDKELQGEGECCAVHEFHKPCIDPWLLEHRTCPMCKMDILKFYGYNFAGSQESILHIDMDDGGLGDSESVSTTPSPEPPPEFSGGHRGSVGTITVSTSTPYGHRDPQVNLTPMAFYHLA